jgi:nitric oxide reductase NorD protein
MSEPEDLIIEGAHLATRVARAAWRRCAPSGPVSGQRLADVRTRLELFITALFQADIVIAPMEPAAPVTWLGRLAGARPEDRTRAALLSGTDGRRVFLPPALPPYVAGIEADDVYRILAVQQAARLARGTAQTAAGADDAARDWFLLAEAALVDGWIGRTLPGLARALSALRAAPLTQQRSGPPHDPFEQRLRAMLAAPPTEHNIDIREDAAASDALVWARSAALREPRRGGRSIAHPWYWGRILPAPASPRASERASDGREIARGDRQRPRVVEMRRRPRARRAADDEEDQTPGEWVIRADDPQETVEDPFGLQRPTDRDDDADPEGLGDALSDLAEARVVRTPDQPREVLRGGDEPARAESIDRRPGIRPGVSYPEWDYRTAAYRHPGAVVREPEPPLGDGVWAQAALRRHAPLIRRVRTRFERLRPRLMRVGRQPDGPELDIDAFVTTWADIRAGASVDGRWYAARRPARRALSVALLVDVSASTDGWVAANRRVVDVEREALLVVCEALDALGDRYGIFAFSGEGPEDVCVVRVKSFQEPSSALVRRRIAALEADGYTRMGTAIRHLTVSLCREQSDRRLLLVLSDGKPNDVDLYEGRYGVEDTRQAVAEARRQGLAVFCLTVDREAPRYARRVFGRAGFAVLRRPEQLPAFLIEALRLLVRA